MFGKLKTPCLKAKGGETKWLVKFATELLTDNDCGEKGRLLAAAGRALLKHYDILDRESRRMSSDSKRLLLEAARDHVLLYKKAGGHLAHKHHGFIHLALSAKLHGNPKCTSSYEDEHENGIVARIGAIVHPRQFPTSVFERLALQDPNFRGRLYKRV